MGGRGGGGLSAHTRKKNVTIKWNDNVKCVKTNMVNMNVMDYGLKKMNEMDHGLKEMNETD